MENDKKMNGVVSQNKICSLEYEGNILDTDQDKANAFAKNFAKISSDENYSTNFKIFKQALMQKECPKASHKENAAVEKLADSLADNFDINELRRAIRETKKHSSPGEDRVSYEMLHHLSKRSTAALLSLYNKVWQEGVFPKVWKRSIIKPVLKPGKSQEKVSSYRPISLTCVIGKVMEKLVTNRITYYVEKKNLLTNVQTGFRRGKSTIDQLVRLQDVINKYNNNKGYTVAVFVDFQSAYDMLWHEGLFDKLENMGITGRVLVYIKNFLSDRTIQVRVGNRLSPSFPVKNGTPQGSIISPLLFLVMINDLPDNIIDSQTSLFADDSCLFNSGRQLDVILRRMQDSLNRLKMWCDKNGFKISLDKTVAVLFTHRRDDIVARLKIGDDFVTVDNKAKFLGLIFDSKLTWNHHVRYIIDKCKKRLNLLRAISGNRWGASKKTLLVVYRGLIRSVLEYGSIAYDSMGDDNKRKLDSIQTEALRIACGAVRGTPAAALQVDTGEPPLQIRRLQQQIQYAAKVKNDDSHPVNKVFQPHWTDRSKKYTVNTNPIRNKVNDFFCQNNSLNWQIPVLPPRPPWRRRKLKVDLSITKAGKKDENPTAMASLARMQMEKYKNSLAIYTDASKTTEGVTSAAFVIPALNVTSAIRLPDKLSIYSAELLAIKFSLEFVSEHYLSSNVGDGIVIFSDSLSSLTAIKTGKSACRPNTLIDIFEILDIIDANVTCTMVWIPSHVGIAGNEAADKAAQLATMSPFVDVDSYLELKDLNVHIQDFILAKWQAMWQSCPTGKFYRKLEPNVSFKIKYENKARANETLATRLRLGFCCTNEYLHRIKATASDQCPDCECCVETIDHLLLRCPKSYLCNKVLDVCQCLNIKSEIESVLKNVDIINVICSNIKRKL